MAGMITDLKTGDTLDFLWHRQRQRQMELFDDFLEVGGTYNYFQIEKNIKSEPPINISKNHKSKNQTVEKFLFFIPKTDNTSATNLLIELRLIQEPK